MDVSLKEAALVADSSAIGAAASSVPPSMTYDFLDTSNKKRTFRVGASFILWMTQKVEVKPSRTGGIHTEF